MASISELAGTQDLTSVQHELCPVRQCLRARRLEGSSRSEQVGVAQHPGECVALLGEQTCGAAPVACSYEVGVVEDGSWQRKRVAVIDQSQPIAIPAPVPVVTVLLGDQRVEERCGQAPCRIQGRRRIPWPPNRL